MNEPNISCVEVFSEDDIRQLVASYNKTNEIIDEFEKRAESPIPSVNEIRYATRHLLDAIKKKFAGKPDWQADLQRAERHVQRAGYDVPEFENSFYVRFISDFHKKFSGYEDLVADCVDDYYTHLNLYFQYGRFLEELHEFDKESPQYKQQCAAYVESMKCFHAAITNGMDLLSQEVEKKSRREACLLRWSRAIFWGSIFLGAILNRVCSDLL